MIQVRERLEALYEECSELCYQTGQIGPETGQPNFRLIYSSVETFESSNGFAMVGLNPAGQSSDADRDRGRRRPFDEKSYSAYVDDAWADDRGQDRFQRAVQGIAMILNGATWTETKKAITATNERKPEERLGTETADLLRNTPSQNIIPFRGSTLNKLPLVLRQRGEEIGWELLCLIRPKPRFIVTLSNGSPSPWRTILKNSGLQRATDREGDWTRMLAGRTDRTYRDVRLPEGPLEGAVVFGLPAVVFDKLQEYGTTPPMLATLSERLRYYEAIS